MLMIQMPEALQVLKTLIDRTAPAEVFNAAYPAFLQVGVPRRKCMQRTDDPAVPLKWAYNGWSTCRAEPLHRSSQGVFESYFVTEHEYTDRQGTRYQDILAFYHHAGTTTAVAGQHKRATELFNFVRDQSDISD